MRNKKIKRITLTALLTAFSVVLSFVESLLPTAYFMPPGSKLGLSNIPVMFCASTGRLSDTLFTVIAKSFFVFITRGFTAFCMSLAGGLLSALCMLVLFKRTKGFGYAGLGIISALCHNLGQILISFLLIGSTAVTGYLPVMLIASVVTGFLTGTLLRAAMPYFSKIITFKDREMEK